MKASGNPQPHEPHGIAKSAATVSLAGLMWVGIASGVPVIQPVAVAASTEAQIEFIHPAAAATEALIEDIQPVAAATEAWIEFITENIDGIVTSSPAILPAAFVLLGPQQFAEIVNKLDILATATATKDAEIIKKVDGMKETMAIKEDLKKVMEDTTDLKRDLQDLNTKVADWNSKWEDKNSK
jgi:hypothetical protein